MYFWKCWRDTRGAFCTFLGAVVGMALLHRAVTADLFGLISSGALGGTQPIWEQSAEFTLRTVVLLMPLAGFVIGALGVGSEFGKQTIPFLLTRPRLRRYFLWSSWLVAAAEMVVLITVSVVLFATRTPVVGPFLQNMGAAQTLRVVLAFLVPTTVIFCLTFCFTVLLKKEQHGTNAAVAAIVSYTGLFAALQFFYGIRIPLFWELYIAAFNHAAPLRALAVAGWLTVAVVMIVIAHFSFERAEV